MKKWLSEFLGTFTLVFAGTGAIVINDVSGGAITHLGIALTFGLVVMAMIYTYGDESGAHLNPAVTIALAASGRIPWKTIPGYVVAQITGALAASLMLRLLFPTHATLGATLPAGAVSQSFLLEIILTAILMLTILKVSRGAQDKGFTAAITIGGFVGLEALFAGPICGASMNPARSLAPALASGQMQHLWLYLTATTLGALLAIPLDRCTHDLSAPEE